MPVGLATSLVPGLAMLTVAVKVTLWPDTLGLVRRGHRRGGAGLVDHLADRRRHRAGGEVAVAAGVGGGDGVAGRAQMLVVKVAVSVRRAAERAGADGDAVVVEGDRAGGVGHVIRARAGDAHRRREGDALARHVGLVRRGHASSWCWPC